MTPRPETNLLICHGVLAPRARWRERVVAYGRVLPEPTAAAAPLAAGPDDAGVKPTPRAWSWAALMHRAFAIDVLACPRGGGRLRLIATLHDPAVIRTILAHGGDRPLRAEPRPRPTRARIGSARERCGCHEAPPALLLPVRRRVDGGGVSRIACRSAGPVRSTREGAANVRCGYPPVASAPGAAGVRV